MNEFLRADVASGDLTLRSWVSPPASGTLGADTVILLHGFLDIGWSLEPLARALRDGGLGARIVMPDWRGHGDSDWVGPGGYYHFLEYVGDLAEVVRQCVAGRTFLVGHSMGGAAAALYSGTFPEKVHGLVNVEGLGPPGERVDDAPERLRTWVESVRRMRPRRERMLGFASVEEAAERLRERNRRLPADIAMSVAREGTRQNERGRWVWKFDPLHRTPSAYPFYLEQAQAFWRRIEAPVLLVEGEDSPMRALPDLAARKACFSRRSEHVMPGVGHMIHHEAPGALARIILEWLQVVAAGEQGPPPAAGDDTDSAS